MPKISIVTPAYNCEKYLEEAVNSVLAQSFEEWELLIIDDCSKDATWLRMQALAKKDNRIRIFQNQHNSGSAATRNNGIRQARGEWRSVETGEAATADVSSEKTSGCCVSVYRIGLYRR